MNKIINYLIGARRRRIAVRIATLEAKIEYWSTLVQTNGTRPEHLCAKLASMKGELAGLKVAINQDVAPQ